MDILVRILISIALVTVGIAAYWLTTRITLQRARNQLAGLEGARPGYPTILYFTSPTCAPCRAVQRPALQSLQQKYGATLQVVMVDAQARPDLADYWGVLSVPTTFVFDRVGTPRFMNPGVASAEKLERQLADAGLQPLALRRANAAEQADESHVVASNSLAD